MVIAGRYEPPNGGTWVVSNQIWSSLDGGRSWGQLTGSPFSVRIFPGALFDSKGELIIAAGTDYQDVWRSTLSIDSNLVDTARALNIPGYRQTAACIGYLPCAVPLHFSQMTANAQFSVRSLAGAAVLSESINFATVNGPTSLAAGSMIVFGGQTTTFDNDIWGSADGSQWVRIAGSSTVNGSRTSSPNSNTFTANAGQVGCAFYQSNKLIVLGGQSRQQSCIEAQGAQYCALNTSWTSTNGGVSWEQNPMATTFATRSYGSCTGDSLGNMFVMNGVGDWSDATGDARRPVNDVWRTSDFGKTWTLVGNAPYLPRMAAAAATAYRQGSAGTTDILYVLAGLSDLTSAVPINDVWALQSPSSAGAVWKQMTASASWPARVDTTATVTSNGLLVIAGGRVNIPNNYYVFNDVYISFDGGSYWYFAEESPWSARRYHSLLVSSAGRLIVIAGQAPNYVNDVWSSGLPVTDLPQMATIASVTISNAYCAGLFAATQACPPYIDVPSPSSDTSAVAVVVVILIVLVVLALIVYGYYRYVTSAYGEFRLPDATVAADCWSSLTNTLGCCTPNRSYGGGGGGGGGDDGYKMHDDTGLGSRNGGEKHNALAHRLLDEE